MAQAELDILLNKLSGRLTGDSKFYTTHRYGKTEVSNYPLHRDPKKVTAQQQAQSDAFLFADQNDITIKVAKFAGTDKSDLIENEEYGYCSIIKSCKAVLDKLNVENRTLARITYPFRQETRLVDTDSLREAVINAFVHNDYSDLMSPAFYIYSDRLDLVVLVRAIGKSCVSSRMWILWSNWEPA